MNVLRFSELQRFGKRTGSSLVGLCASVSIPHNNVSRFLLCKIYFLTFFFLATLSAQGQQTADGSRYRIAFWNVENLFDTENDTLTNDDEYTPEGSRHWSRKRYDLKQRHLAQVVTALSEEGDDFLPPLLVGMAEVENARVLRDLCRGTVLRKLGYDFVHFDSPDRRGIDVALLYRRKHFKPFLTERLVLSDSTRDFYTRDILLVEGVADKHDSIAVFVCHLPSKRGGHVAEVRRMQAAKRLRWAMDTVRQAHPQMALVVMGDFNATPDEDCIREGILRRQLGDTAYVNLMDNVPPGTGSYKYQGNWSVLDHLFVPQNLVRSTGSPRLAAGKHIFIADFLLQEEGRDLGKKLFRTYLGERYLGGYSDHLPVYLDLVFEKP